MARSFVYNDGGGQEESSKTLQEKIQLGFFFDGTTNNMFNTELSQKIQKAAGYAEVDQEGNLTEMGVDAYDQYKKLTAADIRKIPDIEKSLTPEEQKAFKKRDFLEPVSSYVNDQTNVERMYKACDMENYGIYIEGIGTEKYESDNMRGSAMGSGATGIKERAKQAILKLLGKVSKIGDNSTDKPKTINVYIDVFGFSRGAATARYFVYLVNQIIKTRTIIITADLIKLKKKELAEKKKDYNSRTAYLASGQWKQDIYLMHSKNHFLDWTEERIATLKKESKELKKEIEFYESITYTDKELHSKVNLHSEISKLLDRGIVFTFRFMGIYDTVSSYAETSSMVYSALADVVDYGIEGVLKGELSKTFFDRNETDLNIYDVECMKKIVHFTAMDEHRENFSLTRIKHVSDAKDSKRVEKDFPGVHSDIGGSYLNETEKTHIRNQYFSSYVELRKFREDLIVEGWYTEDQISLLIEEMDISDNIRKVSASEWDYLKIIRGGKEAYIVNHYTRNPLGIFRVFFYLKKLGMIYIINRLTEEEIAVLRGTRFLRKEYSYIPLQFMYEYLAKELRLVEQKEEGESIDPIKVVYEEDGVRMVDKTNSVGSVLVLSLSDFNAKYSINESEGDLLVQAKARLRPYVMNEGGKRWEFDKLELIELAMRICMIAFSSNKEGEKLDISSDYDANEIKIERSEKVNDPLFSKRENARKEQETKEKLENTTLGFNVKLPLGDPVFLKVQRILDFSPLDPLWHTVDKDRLKLIEEELADHKNKLLRKLRNNYLHYSAHYDNNVAGLIFPMEPRANRIRQEFPK